MFGQGLRTTLLATATTAALMSGVAIQSANADVLDAWNFNLSAANGVGGYAGMSDLTGLDHIILSGKSTVIQNIGPGTPPNNTGQKFTDSGYLQLSTFIPETPPPFGCPAACSLATFATTTSYQVYFRFDGLTGTVINPAGDIIFDALSGTIALWLDDDLTDQDPTTNVAGPGNGGNAPLKLADFVLTKGGGLGLNFFGGATPTGTVQVTLVQTGENGSLTGPLYTDQFGNQVPSGFPVAAVHLGDVTASLNPAVSPNPAPGPGMGQATAFITNDGTYNIAKVPEASSAAALGFGLLGLAGVVSRRRRKAA